MENTINPLPAVQIYSNSQGRVYAPLMRSTRTHSICTSTTKGAYIRPLTASRATKIFSCQQSSMYIYALHVLRQ